MSIDIFGRQFRSAETPNRGPPGLGFKLTPNGDFNIENKKLCNVADPESNGDAVNMNTVNKFIETKENAIYDVIESLRTDNNVRISTLEDTTTRNFENLKTHIEEKLLSMKESISRLDSRLQTPVGKPDL